MRSGRLKPRFISSAYLSANNGVWKAADGSTTCNPSNIIALSRTLRLNTKSIEAPCHCLPTPGPTGVLPRVGFKPNNPEKEAGIRIDPPPSLAPATGTTPEAIAAAAPPLDPPGE